MNWLRKLLFAVFISTAAVHLAGCGATVTEQLTEKPQSPEDWALVIETEYEAFKETIDEMAAEGFLVGDSAAFARDLLKRAYDGLLTARVVVDAGGTGASYQEMVQALNAQLIAYIQRKQGEP